MSPPQPKIYIAGHRGMVGSATIRELAHAIGQVVGYQGQIEFDPSKPDGTPRKLMDSSRLNALGWQASVKLEEGLASAYQDVLRRAI